jgi:hypothetical protein
MHTFSSSWPDREFVQRTIAQIPWRSNIALLDRLEKSGSAHMVCTEKLTEANHLFGSVVFADGFVAETPCSTLSE